jgi:hypothetical protein
MNLNDIKHFFRRKYQQIQRLIDFLPIIWNGFDFDYIYSIELFKKQLERQAKFMESNKSYSDRAKQDSSRIRTAISLIDKVYNGDYESEWIDVIKEKYGEDILDWEFEKTNEDSELFYHIYKYEKMDNAEEIRKVKYELIDKARKKQKRAHKLLWNFIEHNIQYWWD